MPDLVRHDGSLGIIGACLRWAALLLLIAKSFPAVARTDLITLSTTAQPAVGFTYLPYANPDAPKGGALSLPGLGDFDNLNPFILRGTAPDTVLQIWQPLFKLSDTDSVTEYAELARSVVVQGNTVTFALDPRAKFSDGVPVTASDVVWTYHTLITQGLPFYAAEYSQVAGVVAADSETVVFTLQPGAGPDTVFNLAGLYVLPSHFWANRDFATPLRDPPVGSGAYRVSAVDWGNAVTYTRVQNWWAADLPADKGFNNFDTVTELFFRDKSASLQAFKAGQLDAHIEDSAAQWYAAQTWPEVLDGRIRLALVPETLPSGITGLVMNTRRPDFADARVRQALTLAFDAEWTNRALFGGFYHREHSYFSNSAMASTGLPSAEEVKLLAPYRRNIPPAVFTTPFTLPVTDASGYNLPELEHAMALLNAAGWQVRNFALVNAAGQQMSFEILLDDPKYERIVIPYAHDVGLLGIAATVRTVDPATYLRREQNFDFDMTQAEFPVSDDPGSEQAGYWGCAAARTPGSDNLAGVCSPAIDAIIAAEIAAPNPDAKRTAIHALDRLLLNGWYIVPWFSAESERLEYWQSRLAKPSAPLQVGVDTTLWWAK